MGSLSEADVAPGNTSAVLLRQLDERAKGTNSLMPPKATEEMESSDSGTVTERAVKATRYAQDSMMAEAGAADAVPYCL